MYAFFIWMQKEVFIFTVFAIVYNFRNGFSHNSNCDEANNPNKDYIYMLVTILL